VAGEDDPVPAVGNPIDQISELRSGFGDGECKRGHVLSVQNVQTFRNRALHSPPTCSVIKVPGTATGASAGGRQRRPNTAEPRSVAGVVGSAGRTSSGAEIRVRTTTVALGTTAQIGTSGALALCKQPALAGMRCALNRQC
jgi:hypothetical protein